MKSRFSPHQKECDEDILEPIIFEMYLQKVHIPTIPVFDEKRCQTNEIESIPWN